MKILVFDDHSFVTDTISTFLQAKNTTVFKATKKNEVLDILKNQQVDLLISDVLTDQEIGLSLFEEVRGLFPDLDILVYSSIQSDFVKQCLLDLGVLAIIDKKNTLETIWQTILEIENIKKLNLNQRINVIQELPKLTPKEIEICKLLALGLSAKEIADKTNSSTNTINNQKNNLLEKFNCSNSTELVLKLTSLGFLKI